MDLLALGNRAGNYGYVLVSGCTGSTAIERSWIRIPPGAELFLFSIILSLASLSQVPSGGATLLTFLIKIA